MIGRRWACLVVLSLAAAVALVAARISAALLIGPMAVAIVMAGTGRSLRVPAALFLAAQTVVGIMIARVFTVELFVVAGRRWPLFIAAVASVLAAAGLLGFALTRWRVLPGTAAVWGTFPGAATAMTLMAADYGADVRLVAFMQYLRVAIVALVASLVARFIASAPAHGDGVARNVLALVDPGPVHASSLVATLVLAAVGATVALRLRVPAGALLGPIVLGAVAQDCGIVAIDLPAPLLAAAYALVGWSIGMRFDRAAIAASARALPRVTVALVALVGCCALFSAALVRWASVDPLTAYLAMSPGGADSVAIIAASSSRVDVAFVMALQVTRFVVILACGPALARFIARWSAPHPGAE